MRLTLAVLMLPAVLAAAQSTPSVNSFERLSERARQAYESDRRDQAVALYTQALQLRPDWAQGWWAIGSIQYEAGRPRECRNALRQMVKFDATAAPGWIVLGLCEFKLKLYDSAFESLKRGHMLVPEGHGGELLDLADYHIALLLIHRGAFEMSQEFLLKVAMHVKVDEEKMFACGLAALRMPIFPEEVAQADRDAVNLAGRAFWDLATKPPAEAESSFAALVAKYPRVPYVHYFFGTYLGARRPPDCVKEFLEELRLNPGSVPARVQLVLQYLNEPRADEALKLAREAVRLSPDSVGTQVALGRALSASGDDEGALTAFLAARKLDAESPQIRMFLVGAYRALGRAEDMQREKAAYERLKEQLAHWP